MRNLISGGDYNGAVEKIINSYEDFAFVDSKYYEYVFGEGWGFLTNDISYVDAYTEQKVLLARITMGKGNFDDFSNGKSAYGTLVRNIFHEVIHVEQRLGLNGKPVITDQVEREFTAHFRTITNITLPAYGKSDQIFYLKAVLTDQIKNTDGSIYVNFYNRLSAHKRMKYSESKKTLEKLLNTSVGKKSK